MNATVEFGVMNGRCTTGPLIVGGVNQMLGEMMLVEASKLSLDDEFMRHNPVTNSERSLKNIFSSFIGNGFEDFYYKKGAAYFGGKANYYGFLGCTMKKLVSNGWNVSEVWDKFCNSGVDLDLYM